MSALGRRWMHTLSASVLVVALLFSGGLAFAQQAEGASELVGGRVVSAKGGRPIPRAMVTLTDTASNRTVESARAGEDGAFRFRPVPAGKYRLQGQAAGYLPSAYQAHGQLSTAIVTGAGLPVGDLSLALTPEASITGRVLDEAGDPIPHATVFLFRQDLGSGTPAVHIVNTTVVEDNGKFEFGPLQPGRFFLAASATPWYAVHAPPAAADANRQMFRASVDPALDVAYPTLFYPGARSSDEASPIDLAGGDEFTANLQMVPVRAVTLIIRRTAAPDPGVPDGRVQQSPQLSQTVFGTEHIMAGSVTTMSYPDQIVVQGIAPSRYNLEMQQFGPNAPRFAAHAGSVDLSGGSVTLDEETQRASASVAVTVQTSDGSALPRNLQLYLLETGAGGSRGRSTPSAPVDREGGAEFGEVPPGDFRVTASGGGRNLAIARVSVAGKPETGAKVHVGEGAHLAVSVTLAQGAVNLEGTAQRDGKPAAAELVLLVPAGGDAAPELFRRDQSNLDGSFRLQQVAPGKYLLVALHDGWALPWSDLHAIMPYLPGAQPVTVPAGATGAMHLPEPLRVQTVP